MVSSQSPPPVVLFGYDSSPFTQKVRLALRIKQIPYIFVIVPSMMPRPILRDNFHLIYRKIPVLAIGRDIYCDTSIILEALEHFFPAPNHPSLYPLAADGHSYRAIIRGFASYWTDRPLFRVATGLIPSSVWRTRFGTDRASLIGHPLDASKLERKVPQNLSNLDLHLSILEPQLRQRMQTASPWLFSTLHPSLADVSLFYQLRWAVDIAAGKGISNLTAGGTSDTNKNITDSIFNRSRYPAVLQWFNAFQAYIDSLPLTETKITNPAQDARWRDQISQCTVLDDDTMMLPTPAPKLVELDERLGLRRGAMVSVAPDDTGRDYPTIGRLVGLSSEEIVIKPKVIDAERKTGELVVRVHFPRLGFVVKPVDGERARL